MIKQDAYQESYVAEKPFLTLEDIADLLELNVNTVRRYVREGKIKAIRLGKSYRVRREEFERFLKEQEK